MKKVLLVTTQFTPKQGGAELYYHELCNQFPKGSLAVLADDSFNDEYKGFMPEYDYPVEYKSFYFKSKFIWPKWPKLFFHLYKAYKREKPDIIWAAQPLPIGLVVALFTKVFKVPFFETTHGADVLNPTKRKGFKKKWKPWLLKSILTKASFITANSEYTRLILTKLGIPRERTVIVYPTANIRPSEEHIEQTSILQEISSLKERGYRVVVTTSRLVRRKGVDMTIQAMPNVWKEFPKTVYVSIGDGPYRENLKNIARDTLDKYYAESDLSRKEGPQIIFAGKVTDGELRGLLGLCEMFVMIPREIAGLIEGFGMVYIEAGLFGKPVIGAKTGGAPEAIVELFDQNHDKATGLLVSDPLNTNEIAKKILLLLKDPGLGKKLGENGKEYGKQFTWEKAAKGILEKLNISP